MFLYRYRRRAYVAEAVTEQYHDWEKVTDSFLQRITAMTNMLVELQKQLAESQKMLAQLEMEKTELERQLQALVNENTSLKSQLKAGK